jgi:uncharacterized membrane protein (DUF485 family)
LAYSANGHQLVVDARRVANGVQYGILVLYAFAIAMCAWSAVLGVQLTIDSSVPGGLAVVLIAVIMIAITGWRINFKWKQLHGRLEKSSGPDHTTTRHHPDR